MFDVFYLGQAPGLFAHERKAQDLDQARRLSRTRFCWVIDYLSDYTGFDFLWEPPPWQAHQAHAWPSQHQASGGTWLLPRDGYTDVNREHDAIPRSKSVPRLHIRHMEHSDQSGDINTRYISSYLSTMRRALKDSSWEYCWVTSDVCDYTEFDFTWHPSEWQQEMLHVWASDGEKFGDTFYVHVPTFLEKSASLSTLEFYDALNFISVSVPRIPMPQVEYHTDSMVEAIWKHEFDTPLVQFHQGLSSDQPPTVCLWHERTKTVTSMSSGNSTAVVPRECKNHIRTQVYDYPHIDRCNVWLCDPPMDIVYISNGEPDADVNWGRLLHVKQGQPNRCVRVDGINGRVAAYHAAARASQTPWFFAVFAKLEVDAEFDWCWQPDRFQAAKHYIFHAANPCNGLVYGHQAMIAYNRSLVLANPGRGLDFTLDSEHEVVPVLSGVARYNQSPWVTWRTAFREVLKLQASLPDVENEHRLRAWLENGWGEHGEWSVWGAEDALEFYHSVQGDITELKKSYDWAWLSSYVFMKRNLSPNQ